MHEGGEALV